MAHHHPGQLLTTWAFPFLLSAALFYVVLWRLFLSPIANIPGPRLAALTGLVEFYYDVVKGGKYLFKIEEWHEKYGKIRTLT